MRNTSGDASAVWVPFAFMVDPLAGDGAWTCGAKAGIAVAAMCLQMRPSCAMRTWKSGQVQVPLPCGSSFTLYPVPLLLVTTNSGKSPVRAGASFSFLPLPGPSDCPPSTEGWTAPGMRIVDLELGSLKTCGFSFLWMVAGIAERGGPAQLSHDSGPVGSA